MNLEIPPQLKKHAMRNKIIQWAVLLAVLVYILIDPLSIIADILLWALLIFCFGLCLTYIYYGIKSRCRAFTIIQFFWLALLIAICFLRSPNIFG